MTAISRRYPAIEIEYDCRGKRKRASFQNSARGARRFYGQKLEAGKNPRVCLPEDTGYCDVCRFLFPKDQLVNLPPANTTNFCPDCARKNMLTDRVY